MSETTTPVKIIKTSAAADLDTIRNVASGSNKKLEWKYKLE